MSALKSVLDSFQQEKVQYRMTCYFESLKYLNIFQTCKVTSLKKAVRSALSGVVLPLPKMFISKVIIPDGMVSLGYGLSSSIFTRCATHLNSCHYNFYHPVTISVYFGIADSGG